MKIFRSILLMGLGSIALLFTMPAFAENTDMKKLSTRVEQLTANQHVLKEEISRLKNENQRLHAGSSSSSYGGHQVVPIGELDASITGKERTHDIEHVGTSTHPAAYPDSSISLGIGGFVNGYASFGSQDVTGENRNNAFVLIDGEVHFLGEYTTDDNVTFGAKVELEAKDNTDQIDEVYIYAQNEYGRLLLGLENSAAYIMHLPAPYVGLSLDSGKGRKFIPLPASMRARDRNNSPFRSTSLDYGDDEANISYYTPRFYGFQGGITYTPDAQVRTAGSGEIPVDKKQELHDGVSIGASYVGNIQEATVALSAGYRHADRPSNQTNGIPPFLGSVTQRSVGGQVEYRNVTLGASYAHEDSRFTSEGRAWDVGLKYSCHQWAYGLTYMNLETNGVLNNTSSDRGKLTSLGVAYNYRPGIVFSFNLLHGDWDSAEGENSEGTVGILGTSFYF